MAIGRTSSFLGVAVSDRSATCAEVFIGGGDRRAVRRTATFVFPPDVTLETPDALGQALAGFLRQKRFTASRAVVGVPARWLIAMEKEVPPADEQQARATLRLQAERLAVAEHGEVVFDFAGRTSASTVSKVLLVGMVRDKLQRVEQMMDSAGMTVVAITSTGLTLAAAARGRPDDDAGGGILMLGKSGGEMVWRHDGAARMLRHVSYLMNGHGLPPVGPLGAELHRTVALATSNGDVGSELLLLDGVGLPPEQVTQLSDRLGVPVRAENGIAALRVQVDPSAIEKDAADDAAGVGRFAPAMSLALAAAKPELLPLDFKHSRLAVAPPSRISRLQLWGTAIATILVVGLAGLLLAVRSRENELAELQAQLESLKPQVKTAQATVDRFKYGRGYFESSRPPILDCIKEIASSFRDGERIWVTNVTYREGNRFIVTGKAADSEIALAVINRIRANPRFADVKTGSLVEADQRTREVSYSFTFQFNPIESSAADAATTAPAPEATTQRSRSRSRSRE